MSYQHGYQQQPQGYPGSYPEPGGSTNPVLAVLAGILGLAAAAALVVLNINLLSILEVGLGDLPSELLTIVIIRFAAAAILVIGAIVVFVRKLAGAVILALGGLAGIAAILLYPVVLSDAGVGFGEYIEAIFKFDETQATFSAVALIASPLALIMSILPPTLNYLKGSSDDDFGGYEGGGYDGGGGYGQQYQQPQQPQQQQQQQYPGQGQGQGW